MKSTTLVLFLFALPMTMTASHGHDVFLKGSFKDAQKQAMQEGKIQLVEFVARWCMPCKFMDQTTFQDENVRSYLNANFVSVKIDIDDFDGFALKQQYEVRFLPTILLLNTDGKIIARVEESLGTVALMEFLTKHNTEENRSKKDVREESIAQNSTHSAPQPVSIQSESMAKNSSTLSSYILQFGAFKSLDNANILFEELSNQLPSPPELKSKVRNGEVFFILQYGPFDSLDEVHGQKAKFFEKGIDSIVKPLE